MSEVPSSTTPEWFSNEWKLGRRFAQKCFEMVDEYSEKGVGDANPDRVGFPKIVLDPNSQDRICEELFEADGNTVPGTMGMKQTFDLLCQVFLKNENTEKVIIWGTDEDSLKESGLSQHELDGLSQDNWQTLVTTAGQLIVAEGLKDGKYGVSDPTYKHFEVEKSLTLKVGFSGSSEKELLAIFTLDIPAEYSDAYLANNTSDVDEVFFLGISNIPEPRDE
ncbi:uncharacterized protein CC84DRAFT_1181389 [Paraphaeosphaeria sporulosa]|uniref:Uncharacterized protein n=1 Tax=Paraphaeosphaeria sporulosa TaxID=1460663 RepID=A0A177BVV8_9PLEO|nr:uncharacterized protein CC84DRAFT_1181389 [Paraphaeosphaeria sporulosa]OAF99245.1 hypothetical protein CC84DRAFT_1181389 [Paraphaeosphaeria sporulosa]